MALLRSRRLEVLLGGPIENLTEHDVRALVANAVREDFDLDFKGELYGPSDSAKRDLCADVAALANSSGGVILLGVLEDQHAVASAAPGVAVTDAEKNRMLQIVAAGVAPMPALDVVTIPTSEDAGVGFYVVAVPRSTRAPHAVAVNIGLRYPVRNGTTTRYLSESEVAAAYRQREANFGEREAALTRVVASCLRNIDRANGPWIVVGLVPEHPGSLEINQRTLQDLRARYQSADVRGSLPAGAVFHWVRPSRGKYAVGDGPYSDVEPSLPRYGAAELHTSGAGAWAIALVDLASGRRRPAAPVPNADQMVSDEAVALDILGALHQLAQHARDRTGAAGSATIQVRIAASLGRRILFGHGRRFGIVDSRSHNTADEAIAETIASLDELATPGTDLVATAARLLDELGTSFGIAEMGQFSPEGAIRRRYWGNPDDLMRWAERYGIAVVDDPIAGE